MDKILPASGTPKNLQGNIDVEGKKEILLSKFNWKIRKH